MWFKDLKRSFYTKYYFELSFNRAFKTRAPEAVVQRCSVKKVFLEISQNSQENAYARDSFSVFL